MHCRMFGRGVIFPFGIKFGEALRYVSMSHCHGCMFCNISS